MIIASLRDTYEVRFEGVPQVLLLKLSRYAWLSVKDVAILCHYLEHQPSQEVNELMLAKTNLLD